MSEMTSRKRFHSNILNLPHFAKPAGGQLIIGLVVEGAEMAFVQAITAFIHRVRSGKALLGENGSRSRASGSPTGVQTFGPGAVLQKLKASRSHAEGNTLGHVHLFNVQPQ